MLKKTADHANALFKKYRKQTSINVLISGLAGTLVGYTVLAASAADVTFSGVVDDGAILPGGLGTCAIELTQNGLFASNTSATVLNSQISGGQNAVIQVTSNQAVTGNAPGSGFEITLESPTTFSQAPLGGNTSVNFSTLYSGASITDGLVFGLQSGANVLRLPESGLTVTQISGHLRAEKTSGIFPVGSYQAEAVFRCE